MLFTSIYCHSTRSVAVHALSRACTCYLASGDNNAKLCQSIAFSICFAVRSTLFKCVKDVKLRFLQAPAHKNTSGFGLVCIAARKLLICSVTKKRCQCPDLPVSDTRRTTDPAGRVKKKLSDSHIRKSDSISAGRY